MVLVFLRETFDENFDCFMYFDEDLLLEIRLDTLFDYVDKFIIVEANIDHAGNKKRTTIQY